MSQFEICTYFDTHFVPFLLLFTKPISTVFQSSHISFCFYEPIKLFLQCTLIRTCFELHLPITEVIKPSTTTSSYVDPSYDYPIKGKLQAQIFLLVACIF